jgi:hypothetical protein
LLAASREFTAIQIETTIDRDIEKVFLGLRLEAEEEEKLYLIVSLSSSENQSEQPVTSAGSSESSTEKAKQ